MPGVSVIITACNQAAYNRSLRAYHVKHFGRLDGAVLDVLLPLYRLARWSGRPADGRGPVPGRDG